MRSRCLLRAKKKKHPEHFEEIKKLTKQRKKLSEQLDTFDKNKKNLAAFESKTISAFTTAVTGRLVRAFPDCYDRNKVPAVLTNDRSLFLELLKNMNRNLMKLVFSTRLTK